MEHIRPIGVLFFLFIVLLLFLFMFWAIRRTNKIGRTYSPTHRRSSKNIKTDDDNYVRHRFFKRSKKFRVKKSRVKTKRRPCKINIDHSKTCKNCHNRRFCKTELKTEKRKGNYFKTKFSKYRYYGTEDDFDRTGGEEARQNYSSSFSSLSSFCAEEDNLTHSQSLKILGVAENSTIAEINKAFRLKSLVFHPDKNIVNSQNLVDQRTRQFRLICKAREKLLQETNACQEWV